MDAKERKAWLAKRRKSLGGSDAASILGLSKWTTALDIYLSKTDDDYRDESNYAMYRGRILEPAILQMYSDATGLAIERPREMFYHKDCEFISATLDGIAARTIVVDAKTARSKNGWGEPFTDDVPLDYLIQQQQYMGVVGLYVADLAVLFGDFDFAIYRIARDDELIEMIFAAEKKFWIENVVARVPPEPRDARDAIKLFPRATEKLAKQASSETLAELAALAQLKRELEELEDARDALEAKIKSAMGVASVLKNRDEILARWSNVAARETIDAKRLKQELPNLYKVYAKLGEPTRRFSIEPDAIRQVVGVSSQTPVERIEQCQPQLRLAATD
jgi:putative phage-type endonuclease